MTDLGQTFVLFCYFSAFLFTSYLCKWNFRMRLFVQITMKRSIFPSMKLGNILAIYLVNYLMPFGIMPSHLSSDFFLKVKHRFDHTVAAKIKRKEYIS